MSDWPPIPSEQSPTKSSNSGQGREWQILEKAVLASVAEQRRSRRWGIFFKILSFVYLLVILAFFSRGCSSTSSERSMPLIGESHLAVVKVNGTIGSTRQQVNSQDTIDALEQAFKASSSKAVVLQINSPGGSPVESDEIWRAVRELKQKNQNKKIYAVIGDIGASGAYYIASSADKILVNPSSIVGSIGVIMPNYGVEDLAKRLGVEDRTMTSGEHKASLSMTQPINATEKAHMQQLLDDVHQQFIQAVKIGRGDRLKNDPEIFSGLIWTGQQAIDNGLADEVGSLRKLKHSLKVDKVVDYTIEGSSLNSLFGRIGAAVGTGFAQSISSQAQTTPMELK